jgi:hypothetical protein
MTKCFPAKNVHGSKVLMSVFHEGTELTFCSWCISDIHNAVELQKHPSLEMGAILHFEMPESKVAELVEATPSPPPVDADKENEE